jgi:hypothetical protein
MCDMSHLMSYVWHHFQNRSQVCKICFDQREHISCHMSCHMCDIIFKTDLICDIKCQLFFHQKNIMPYVWHHFQNRSHVCKICFDQREHISCHMSCHMCDIIFKTDLMCDIKCQLCSDQKNIMSHVWYYFQKRYHVCRTSFDNKTHLMCDIKCRICDLISLKIYQVWNISFEQKHLMSHVWHHFQNRSYVWKICFDKKNISWQVFQKSSQAWKIVFDAKKTQFLSRITFQSYLKKT